MNMNNNRLNICQKQEQFVLERSARLNLDPGRVDYDERGERLSFVEAVPSGWSFA